MPWDYILSAIGLTGFFLAGKKLWWSWYINILNQVFWAIYSITTEQWGFMIATAIYFVLFSRNAYLWTVDRFGPNEKFRRYLKGEFRKKFDEEFDKAILGDPNKEPEELVGIFNDPSVPLKYNNEVIGEVKSFATTSEGFEFSAKISDPDVARYLLGSDEGSYSFPKATLPIYSTAAGFCEAVIDGLVCGQESCAAVHMTKDGHDYVH